MYALVEEAIHLVSLQAQPCKKFSAQTLSAAMKFFNGILFLDR
jgi:hypothetical protein